MDTDNWRPTAAQCDEPSVETGGDWRTQLPTDSRQRIVNKIMETLKRHPPFSGQEGPELKQIAVRFEEKIYTAAMSQSDYLRKISLKMLTMESKSQNTIPNSLPPNPSGNNNRSSVSGEPYGILMDTNNRRPTAAQGAEPSEGTGGDWRTQLPTDSRERIVNKIVETLKRHPSFSGQEGLEELKKIAVHREEKIYTAATSKCDYLRRISLKMLSMEYKSQNTIPVSLPPNPSGNNNMPPDSGATLDSTAQTGHSNRGDWQEEVHQKIKAMKEMYLPELNEMYQKIALKLQQHDSLPQPPKSQQLEKLKLFKTMLERILAFLQVPKSNIIPSWKEKLGSYEKQILNFINSNKMRKSIPPLLQGQLGQPHMQQPQSQVSQVQSLENQINPQIQSLNMQGSIPTMQLNNMAGMQQTSLSSLSGILTSQQIMNSLQPASSFYSGQGNATAPQQGNVTDFSWQSRVNMLQPNIPLQSNPNMLQHHHLQQQQEQMLKQLQMLQQILMQQMQQQQQQQQQLFNNQAKQQLPAQMQAHQMPQVHPMSDINELKIRQGMGVTSGVFQQHISASLYSTAQTGNSNGGDWQEEVHQKIKAMKEMYLPDLNEMHQKIALKLQQHDSLPQPRKSEQLEKLKMFKTMLERILAFLQVPKSNIIPSFKDKLGSYEKQIINFINSNKTRKSIPPLQQGQLGQPRI